MQRQRTIEIPDKNEKIRVITRTKTNCGNFCGYDSTVTSSKIPGKKFKYHCETLDIETAMARAFSRFVKENR